MSKVLKNRLKSYRRILDTVHDMYDKMNDVIDTVSDLVNDVNDDDDIPFCDGETNCSAPLYVQQRMVEDEEGNCSTLSVTITPAKFLKIVISPADDPSEQWSLSLTLRETAVLRNMIDEATRAAGKSAADKSDWVEF